MRQAAKPDGLAAHLFPPLPQRSIVAVALFHRGLARPHPVKLNQKSQTGIKGIRVLSPPDSQTAVPQVAACWLLGQAGQAGAWKVGVHGMDTHYPVCTQQRMEMEECLTTPRHQTYGELPRQTEAERDHRASGVAAAVTKRRPLISLAAADNRSQVLTVHIEAHCRGQAPAAQPYESWACDRNRPAFSVPIPSHVCQICHGAMADSY